MVLTSDTEKCLSFVRIQLNPPDKGPRKELGERPVLTISRQTGAGGTAVAGAVADYLNERKGKRDVAWTVFDRNLIEVVLEDHELPKQLAEWMPEDRFSGISDAVEELLGLHPSRALMIRQTTETILRLAEMGSCILVGRGAHVITSTFPNAFHVRLVGSVEARTARVMDAQELSRKAAAAYVAREDKARQRFVKKFFKADIDDPLTYHLVLNTDRIPLDEAAKLIGEAVLLRSR